MLCALLLPKNTTASELFKSLNDYFAEKLNYSFCVGVCTDGAAAMIGRLSGLTVRIKEVSPKCKATHYVIYREMLASRKISPEVKCVLDDIVKIISLIKAHARGCLSRYMRTWKQSIIESIIGYFKLLYCNRDLISSLNCI